MSSPTLTAKLKQLAVEPEPVERHGTKARSWASADLDVNRVLLMQSGRYFHSPTIDLLALLAKGPYLLAGLTQGLLVHMVL